MTLHPFRLHGAARAAWLAALLSPALPASAQEAPRGAYLGIGLADMAYQLRSDGSAFLDTTVATAKFYGGFRLSRRWGFEASYQITDDQVRQGVPNGFGAGSSGPALAPAPGASTRVRLELATMRLIRHRRFDWGQLFAGIGLSGASVDTELRFDGVAPVTAGFHAAKNGLTFDAGTQWDFAAWSLRLEYEWWDADMQAAGLYFQWNL
jgi:opacity protein-like surface antigen